MTYKKSMLYGALAMGLAQTLAVIYAYLFNSLNELGKATIPLSLMAIVLMAFVGAVPGVVLHFIKSRLPRASELALGFIIFIGLNSFAYILADELNDSVVEIIYSSIVYGVCGIFMGHMYSKSNTKIEAN